MYNGASRWGQAFDHWCLAVFSFWYTWLYKGVTCFVFLLSFPLSLPFDLTLSYWVCLLFCFVIFWMLCYVWKKKKKKKVDKKRNTLVQKFYSAISLIKWFVTLSVKPRLKSHNLILRQSASIAIATKMMKIGNVFIALNDRSYQWVRDGSLIFISNMINAEINNFWHYVLLFCEKKYWMFAS